MILAGKMPAPQHGAGCGVRGYLLHTPHSLTLYSALHKIVLPYQDNDNIFKILCQFCQNQDIQDERMYRMKMGILQ
jgi:hypothetical protein